MQQRLCFIGKPPQQIYQLLEGALERGYSCAFETCLATLAKPTSHDSLPIVIVCAAQVAALEETISFLKIQPYPCLIWNLSDDPEISLVSYLAGLPLVLPAQSGPSHFFPALQRLSKQSHQPQPNQGNPNYRQRYPQGGFVELRQGQALVIEEGIIGQSMLYNDGSEVLFGLYGPGQLMISHPEDSCAIQLQAHSDLSVRIFSAEALASHSHYNVQLQARIRLMEAWAAMQARPYLDQRIIGLLSLLAEQFGRRDQRGLLVDLRLTHAQLASALGVTRTTITRTIGQLRDRRMLTTIGQGEHERFCLLQWEESQHLAVENPLQKPSVTLVQQATSLVAKST
jgi:CRP-like cAMP-binding protein